MTKRRKYIKISIGYELVIFANISLLKDYLLEEEAMAVWSYRGQNDAILRRIICQFYAYFAKFRKTTT